MNVLVINPGGNSLKAEVVRCDPGEKSASDAHYLKSVIVEGIGKEGKLSEYSGKAIAHSEPIEAPDYKTAAANIFQWLQSHLAHPSTSDYQLVGVRVVHGGARFSGPVLITPEVEREIVEFEKWAPLHNKRSVEILPAVRKSFPGVPIFAVFDTAFHRTIPDSASTYAIPYELSQKREIRRYGFHGISHRYLMERYARLTGRTPQSLKLVTMHLESGCSVTAIAQGRSVDNTMGLTPLEGLMMGTRSGDVDPALIPFLAQAEGIEIDEVMNILNKKSGLFGVSGVSLDTRVLVKQYDSNARVRLAMEMFAYRVLKTVGAYLCALGGADAVIFGGGIAENTTIFRERVCAGLRWCGLEMDAEQNRRLIDIEGRLSTASSPLRAWVIPVEEGLQIAHECCQAQARARSSQAA
jgi:acetate kinase